MPLPHSAKLQRPKSEDEFEDIVTEALRIRWRCQTERNGRRGQGQDGVDIFGRPAELEGRHAGAQCKNRDDVDLPMVVAEVEKATRFRPKLAQYLIVTGSARDAEFQEEVRIHFEEHPALFDVGLMFWEDICSDIAAEPALVRKYWPAWVEQYADSPRGYESPPHWRREPCVGDLLMSTAVHQFAERAVGERAAIIERELGALEPDWTLTQAVAEGARLGTHSGSFLRQELERWERALAFATGGPPRDPALELVFLGATDEAEIDIGLRNLGEADAVITAVTITVLKDFGYVAPMLAPSANYRVPVGELHVGDYAAVDVRHVVPVRQADRFLVDTDDIRTLLLNVRLGTNGRYAVSADVWLFSQGFEDDD